MPAIREILHFHLFHGLGGGARGFNRAQVRVGSMEGRFRCIGGVDCDAAAVRDFGRLAGVPGTLLDLFDAEQFRAFHGGEPPVGWRPATAADLQAAAGGERPHIVFLSAPCKGFSGLLSETRSASAKYQALNQLTLRGVWLMLEAWADDPPELVLFENVPRIATRGRALLDRIVALLRAYGYVTAETTHDCGQLGGLAQSRKRFLLVARHQAKVAPFLYEPPRRALRGVGEVIGRLPLPGVAAAGPMHRVPALQWKTWVRLAFVEAGSDWRSLNRLRVQDGMLADYAIAPSSSWHRGVLGVRRWDEPMGVVAGASLPGNGAFSVADPRFAGLDYSQYGVRRWDESTGTVINVKSPGQGSFAVADPRHAGPPKHSNEFLILPWDAAGRAVTSAHGSGQCVADPRPEPGSYTSKYRVTRVDEPAGTVISASTTGQGAFAVADPRYHAWHPGASSAKLRVTGWGQRSYTVTGSQQVASGALAVADPRPAAAPAPGQAFHGSGGYGVVAWKETAAAVTGSARHDNGRWNVADPRPALPAVEDRLVAVIRALDDTWHRPFTTLELAALQSLVCPEEQLELDGLSDAAWRERIGNAVPPDAAQAIAETMGRTLLLAWSGQGFALSSVPIWVRPVAVALSVRQP